MPDTKTTDAPLVRLPKRTRQEESVTHPLATVEPGEAAP